MTHLRLALSAFLLLLLPSLASATWNDKWKQRGRVDVNTSRSGVQTAEGLNKVPVLVRLHSGNFDFTKAKADGSDLRFIAGDDKTPLKFHIERWDLAAELAIIWVQVPTVPPNSDKTSLWVYYGNPEATPEVDVPGTYEASFVGIWHFSEKDGLPQDQSANANHAKESTAGRVEAALIGGGLSLDGKQWLVLPSSPSLLWAAQSAYTLSMWIQPSGAQDGNRLFSHQDGQRSLVLGFRKGGVYVRVTGSGAPVESAPTPPLAPDTWHHLVVTVSKQLTVYVDGQKAAEAPATLPDLGGSIRLGASGAEPGFKGQIDELQLSNQARTADWVKIAYGSQGTDAALVAVSLPGEDSASEGGGSYFGILIANLTTDAWVVIIILMIMFVIAVGVMIGKTQFIMRTDRDNRSFLQRFRQASDGFLDLDHSGSLKHSSLYRLYRSGVAEVTKRFKAGSDGAALSGASINAIKAAIDADLVRESHRLNSQMVLLTIAISGGPFLGLLGTVVGVMITFAAIAAAGDVNVNAIAPGIAAALLATVAGLSVAIPALFGYNYLASRIKNINADMQIFVDELVTRIAESYSV